MTTYDYLDDLEPSVAELKKLEQEKHSKPKVARNGAYYNHKNYDWDIWDTLPVFVRNGIDEALRHEEGY